MRTKGQAISFILAVMLVMFIVMLLANRCIAQTFDLKEVCGYGYKSCEQVDGAITIDDNSLTINIVQDHYRLFRVKQNPVTGKPVKFQYGRETTIELETLGSTSFITFSDYRTKNGDLIYLFELVRKFAKDDEETTYYKATKL